jgi:thiol-disulfide isomerase/thioredoxin
MQNTPPKSNNNIYAFVGVVVVIAISIVGILAYNNSKDSADAQNSSSSLAKNNSTNSGTFTDYSSNLLANAEKGSVVLFFNASWCPSCQSTVRDINSNLDNIPGNLTILSTDYDKETALKQKYGVTTQHTFVKVDKDGNQLKKASGLNTLQEISEFAKDTSATNSSEISTETTSSKTAQDTDSTKPGIYTDYSSNLLANAENGSVVLFFNASWCPTCRVAVRNINDSLDSIPSDLTILSVDYDDSTDLKRKYGVTYQHTLVKVDKDGNQLKKANNLNTVQEIADFAKN